VSWPAVVFAAYKAAIASRSEFAKQDGLVQFLPSGALREGMLAIWM